MIDELPIDKRLSHAFNKDQLVERLRKNPEDVKNCIDIMLGDQQPHGWRAAWVLKSVVKDNDPMLLTKLDQVLLVLGNRPDGHQRELLHLIQKITLTDEQEGLLFDTCLHIWESIHKSPSVRIVALKQLQTIILKYPELVRELQHVLEDEFAETLTPGVKRIFQRIRKELLELVVK